MPQIGCDDLATGTLGALADTVVIASPSSSTVSAQITGTFSGTITWEGNTDRPGNNWTAITAAKTDGTGTVATTAVLAGAPNNVSYVLNMGAFKRIRARCSAYTSGTATVHFNASVASFAPGLAGIGGGGGPATIADGADTAQGTTTDAGIITDANGTVIGFLRGAIKMWINFLARFPAALGGTTAAASLPVALASDGTYATLQGGVTEAAPGTDTASSGANGRLQRIAQRLSSLITALGSPFQAGGSIGNTAFGLSAGTASAGNVGGLTKTVDATLTRPANTTTYTANDEMADVGTAILTLTNAATATGGKGIITHCLLSCSSNGATKPTFTVYIYDTTSTPQTDNAAFAPADGVQDTCVGSFTLSSSEVGDATSNTGNFTMDSGQIHIPFLTVGSANLYARIKVTNGYTPGTNSDTYKLRFKIQQDAN